MNGLNLLVHEGGVEKVQRIDPEWEVQQLLLSSLKNAFFEDTIRLIGVAS